MPDRSIMDIAREMKSLCDENLRLMEKEETFDCDSCGETYPESCVRTPDKDGDVLLCEKCYDEWLIEHEVRVDLKRDYEDDHLEEGRDKDRGME